MRPLFVALLTFLLCGCADVEYTAYSGRQQNWPVASGSFVQRKFALPVYFGAPDRPYRVIGYLEVETPPAGMFDKPESVRPAVREAVKQGADAIILLGSTTETAGVSSIGSMFANASVTGNTVSASGFGSNMTGQMRRGHARAIAIQFL